MKLHLSNLRRGLVIWMAVMIFGYGPFFIRNMLMIRDQITADAELLPMPQIPQRLQLPKAVLPHIAVGPVKPHHQGGPKGPSVAFDATNEQVLAWGKPLLEQIREIRDKIKTEQEQWRQQKKALGAKANEVNSQRLDGVIESAMVEETEKYVECCQADAIRYRDALLTRLPGGSRNSNADDNRTLVIGGQFIKANVYEMPGRTLEMGIVMRAKALPYFLDSIVSDLDRLTELLSKQANQLQKR